VPQLNKSSSNRRHPGGDFLAVLLLLLIVAGLSWFWWHQKHPQKTSRRKPAAVVKTIAPVVVSQPTMKPPLRAKSVQQPATNSVSALPAPPEPAANFAQPVRTVFEAQVALVRGGISPGPLDGAIGSQTRGAIAAFQRSEKLPVTGSLDAATRTNLTLDAPLLTVYAVTTNDLACLQPLGKTWLAKSEQSALDYETMLELVAEKSHAHPVLIQKLNPGVNWTNVGAGTILQVPDATYPEADGKAAFVTIHLSGKFLEAFDAATNLLLHCPCSIAAKVEKRPVGELHVAVVAPHPNYTVNPELFPESAELQAIGHKLILQPGPNNPVGVAWVGLDKPGYGMHGTPGPEQVGRTESHGCFRLANWDAEYLLKLVWVGMPVEVVP
jgi:lipoprotein-anchoring transpeptidase ErfK/SrfK